MAPAQDKANFTIEELRTKARWIRDDLEQNIVQSRNKLLNPDTVQSIHGFLVRLSQQRPPSIDTLRASSIHRAIILVSGRATRWPAKLVDVCDEIIEKWETELGNLDKIRIDLYGPGERLHGIAEPRDLSRRALVERWTSGSGPRVSLLKAYEHGHLDFQPGDWWIHPIFAFHAGVISLPDSIGSISYDSEGAYAITLTDADTMNSTASIDSFVYRTRDTDPGRFKLMNGILPVKPPLRVLRSHTLRSIYSPIAGVRYDGLYKITSWSGRGINGKLGGKWVFDLTFKREKDQVPIAHVLGRPLADELDDYKEYRRIREETGQRVDHLWEEHEQDRHQSEGVRLQKLRQKQIVSPEPAISPSPFRTRRPGVDAEMLGISSEELAAAVEESLIVVSPPIPRRVSPSERAFSRSDTGDSAGSETVEEPEPGPALEAMANASLDPHHNGHSHSHSHSTRSGPIHDDANGHHRDQARDERPESETLTGLKSFAFPSETPHAAGPVRGEGYGTGHGHLKTSRAGLSPSPTRARTGG